MSFQITPDIVNRLSVTDMAALGISDIAQCNILRQRCHLHGAAIYSGSNSRDLIQDEYVLQTLLDDNFTVKQIAEMFLLSEKTIYRRLETFGLSARSYTDITDQVLDEVVHELIKCHPNVGAKMLGSFLMQQKIRVQRYRVRDSMHRVDADGVELRRQLSLHRRQYSVPAANFLWHIDGNHKLIRYVHLKVK